MTGALVYSPEGYRRNRWFADRLIACARTAGLDLSLARVPPGEMFSPRALPDVAIVRTIRPDISRALEEKGVKVVNNALTARVANDKWTSFRVARELGLPTLDTVRFSSGEAPGLAFPYVVKSLDGHGGSEVFRVAAPGDLARIFAVTGKAAFIAQPFCDTPGVDVRVYALGARVIGAVCRRRRDDFRSNFSLGGEAEAVAVAPEQRAAVARLHARLGFTFAGVDFIRHANRWIFNEIEDVVGTRMLYATTAVDAAQVLAKACAAPA